MKLSKERFDKIETCAPQKVFPAADVKELFEAPLRDGWVVVVAREPLKNSDDLHVMRVRRDDADVKSFVRWNGSKLNLKVLCEPLRYRSRARHEKKKIVAELRLRYSEYRNSAAEDCSY